MTETYCGKNCSECMQKQENNCPGCKTGPGRTYGGDCEIAKCCREKGHESCDTCSWQENCRTRQSCGRQPDIRRSRIEAEQKRQKAAADRALLLGKWLWILFWLIVPATIAGFLKTNNVMKSAPGLYVFGQVLNIAYSVAYGIVLLQLAAEEDRYHTAGVCALVSAAIGVLIIILFGNSEAPVWSLLITLPAAVVALIGEYNEYGGHSAVLEGTDNELSEKWMKLWKWYIRFTLCTVGGMIFMLFAPVLGAIAALVGAVGTAVTGIMKLIYLYRTAQIFRSYSSENLQE